ncbi:tRNA (adenosine(37)-N6)-threonylcarbamoyltransferase complex ATPase subunit type 1 TsaE [Eisenibacter elegans]|jgi:tRNA threonylcarbamoyladenosine biosynthesis protein TsaE|uniref:tRNA (adenosine(37)-N6)-threonylcarbamoyltransferase complex ATPase subunit type 1 TsaE n=1 Tax=Eisenibacter elegans TaxID=997 RepID=UPI0005559C6B|nr:tRNA (adenosine(37)-N6)-threonylcarbamoyltransferase complex ATPase subunit type 1 TsaE [Eisenibacter elegans]
MEQLQIAGYSLSEIAQVAQKICNFAGEMRIWRFEGEMGAGKTTLIQAVVRALGSSDRVQSPTFGLVNQYQDPHTGEPMYHFDFYRLADEAEAYALGCEEYFDSGAYCFVEWAERIPTLLPAQHLHLRLEILDPEHRTIVVQKYE